MTNKTQTKKDALFAALVKLYGEGSVVTREQIYAVSGYPIRNEQYAHHVTVTKNTDYKIGRGLFLVTSSETPSVLRDKVLAERAKVEVAKEKTRLPKAVRTSTEKLLAAVKNVKPAKTPSPTARKLPSVNEPVNDMIGFEIEEDNINEIMANLN